MGSSLTFRVFFKRGTVLFRGPKQVPRYPDLEIYPPGGATNANCVPPNLQTLMKPTQNPSIRLMVKILHDLYKDPRLWYLRSIP